MIFKFDPLLDDIILRYRLLYSLSQLLILKKLISVAISIHLLHLCQFDSQIVDYSCTHFSDFDRIKVELLFRGLMVG